MKIIVRFLSAIWRVAIVVSSLFLASCSVVEKKAISNQTWQTLLVNVLGSDEPLTDANLKGWTVVGDSVWQVAGNTVMVKHADTTTFLRTNKAYQNFHLKLEFWVDDQTNSGVFFRCAETKEISPFNCYEANIWDNHPNQAFRTGALVMIAEPIAQVDTLEKWNSYDIIAKGQQITLKVNGEVTSRVQTDKFSAGAIALQYAGTGVIKFRNLSIREL